MRHLFLINPAAGGGKGCAALEREALALGRGRGLELECRYTQGPGHARELARAAAEEGGEVRVYACGGDGTLHEAANGLAGYENAAMTAVPLGTGNDFLRNFGPDAARFSRLEELLEGEPFPLDLIDCQGEQCLTIACAGLDAKVARDVHRYSRLPLVGSSRGYVLSLGVNFLLRPITNHWRVTLDGEDLPQEEWVLSAVCNGRYYGGGFMPVPEARMGDGILEALLVRRVSRLRFLQFVGPFSRGEHQAFSSYALCRPVREVRLRALKDKVVYGLDGEVREGEEVTFRLSGKKLRFFAPPGAHPDATARQSCERGDLTE